jgi:hypothetical protein
MSAFEPTLYFLRDSPCQTCKEPSQAVPQILGAGLGAIKEEEQRTSLAVSDAKQTRCEFRPNNYEPEGREFDSLRAHHFLNKTLGFVNGWV